jgi:MoxR-like ATPase
LEHLLKLLKQRRRLVIFGAAGIGKSNLARQLAKYLVLGLDASVAPSEAIVDVSIPSEDCEPSAILNVCF